MARGRHNVFVAKPMKDAVLTDLPGIGVAVVDRLEAANINNPRQLMGWFLVPTDWHASGGDAC